MSGPRTSLIKWAPRVPLHKLRLLYESDAALRLDTDLLDDVAWSLFVRCKDVLLVSRGRVRCPQCGTEFAVGRSSREARSHCPACPWTVTNADWHKSWEHQDLWGLNAEESFARFVDALLLASGPSETMLLVDRLVHSVHRPAKGAAQGNLAARNLFEGRTSRIRATLDRLAYGPERAQPLDQER
jgi:hypothetical protein